MHLSKELVQRILSGTATLDEMAGVPIEEILAVRSDAENIQWIDTDGGLLEVRADQAQAKERSATYVMSTGNGVGRTKDVIKVNGWDWSDFEKRGRPLLYNHNLTESHDHLPLGRVDNVRKGRARGQRALIGDAVFTPAGAVPFNDMVFRLVDEGFLPGSSVGFRALSTRLPRNEEERKDLGLGPMSVIHEKTSLVEFSVTPVGMDPDATKLTALKGVLYAWEDQYGRETVQHFRDITRGLEPETRTTITVPDMPFGAGLEESAPEPETRSADTLAIEALSVRIDEIEHDLRSALSGLDQSEGDIRSLTQSVQNILEAFGVRRAEGQSKPPALGGDLDDDTWAALFGGGND
jgi:phage head maturation protease